MSDEEDMGTAGGRNTDDRFTKVENDVFNIEGYGETKPEDENQTTQESSQPLSNKDKQKKEKKDYKKFKIILLGEKGVGKSSLIERYVNSNFSNFESQGIRDAVYNKKYDVDKNLTVELSINDTSEVENLQKYPRDYFNDAHGAILVFSLADHRSFERLSYWKTELNDNAPSDVVTCILGNQSDRTADRKVDQEEAQSFAEGNLYYEVSAKAGNNISMAFENLANKIIQKQKEEKKNPDKVLRGKEGRKSVGLKPKTEIPPAKKKCC
jgi:small GTP-binding protein